MTRKPTIAEESLARLIAFWHGSHVIAVGGFLGPGVHTLADYCYPEHAGHAFNLERYVDRRWSEYVGAARAVLARQNSSDIPENLA